MTLDRRLLLRLMIALFATSIAGWQFKAHCTADGGWADSEQYVTGCYSDAVPFWGGRGVAAGELPYFQARLEYPVLTGALIWIDGRVTRGLFGAQANAAHFLFVVSVANALLAALVLWMLWAARVSAPRLWAWALAPPLVLYLGHNWDMLAIAFAVAALLAARRGRLVRAAVTAGAGVAAKLFPIVFLPLFGLAALFARGSVGQRFVAAAGVTAAAVAAWAVFNIVPAVFAFENWAEFYSFSQARSGTAASAWELASQFGWFSTGIEQRNLYASLLFAGGAVAIVLAGWRRHGAQLWVLATPVLAWFMLTNKVYSPQFDLWLYPLLLMTCRRPALIAWFVAAGIAAYFAEFWYFAAMEGRMAGFGVREIAVAAAVRAAAMMAIIVSGVVERAPDWVGERPRV